MSDHCPYCGKRSITRKVQTGEKKTKISIAFDPETFTELNARATKNGTSYAQAVREMVELGLEMELETSY